MKLRIAGALALGACAIGLSACSDFGTPISAPITGTVDRVSPMNDMLLGSKGGTYFTITGDITKTYACNVDTDQACATLAKGDKIKFTLSSNIKVHTIEHVS